MADAEEVSLTIRAVYDHAQESVGLDIEGSAAFQSGQEGQAIVEILAAIVAKANFMAAEAIRQAGMDDSRKQELLEHYASLKEHMLNDLLEEKG